MLSSPAQSDSLRQGRKNDPEQELRLPEHPVGKAQTACTLSNGEQTLKDRPLAKRNRSQRQPPDTGEEPMIRNKTLRAAQVVSLIACLALGGLVAQPYAQDPGQELMSAVQQGDLAKVKELIAAGADVNARRKDGGTALMYALGTGRTEIARALIAAGADVNARDQKGATALIVVSAQGRTDMVRALIAAGADVNARNAAGHTALMIVSSFGHTEAARILIAAKADVNAKDEKGRTALMYASHAGHSRVVNLLKQAGAKE